MKKILATKALIVEPNDNGYNIYLEMAKKHLIKEILVHVSKHINVNVIECDGVTSVIGKIWVSSENPKLENFKK